MGKTVIIEDAIDPGYKMEVTVFSPVDHPAVPETISVTNLDPDGDTWVMVDLDVTRAQQLADTLIEFIALLKTGPQR